MHRPDTLSHFLPCSVYPSLTTGYLMKVAVRSLCEFAARSGSLEFRYTPSPTSEEGIRGHQKLQSRRVADAKPYAHYDAEYLLEGSIEGITLKGRADGYWRMLATDTAESDGDASIPLLEEIKTHRGELERIGEGQKQLHLAQLKVYGALLCLRDNLSAVRLRLVYFDIDRDQESPTEHLWQASVLQQFAQDLCRQYRAWHKQEAEHRQQRDSALEQLMFPYPAFRPFQRELSEAVYKGIYTQRQLLLEAPTGLGKTLGVSFPALKAMVKSQLDRLFLLSSRTTGRQLFLDALRQLVRNGQDTDDALTPVPLRILELSAKEKSCEHPDKACHGDSCPLARGFFDRLPQARQAAANCYWLDQNEIRRIALSNDICPYYLTQEMARWSDLIVGDVNHYFDRQALLFSLTLQNDWRVVPLVDEAHNLIDRARGMYSAQLDRALYSKAAKCAPEPLKKPIQAVQQGWRKLIAEAAGEQAEALSSNASRQPLAIHLDQVPDQLNGYLHQLVTELTDYLVEQPGPQGMASQQIGLDPQSELNLQQLLFDTLGFLRLAELFDRHSLCTLELSAGQTRFREPKVKATLRIQNLIPADFLRERFNTAFATVLFSATLSPAEYYRDLLGMAGGRSDDAETAGRTESTGNSGNTVKTDDANTTDKAIKTGNPIKGDDTEDKSKPDTSKQIRDALWFSLPGPFRREQLDLRLVPISTRFKDRNRSIEPLCQRIARQYQQKPGNYLVYLSSFSYLEQLQRGLERFCSDLPLQVQSAGMKEEERQRFIQRFRQEQGLVGLAVLGGAFSEGIDLPGDALIGVFVATLGLPPYDSFHETLSQRLEQRFGDGYRYTYLYPGLRKVIQAAGRLIRTPEDTGVIELIDDRFMQQEVQALMPGWWFSQP